MSIQLTRNFHQQVFDSDQYQNHPELLGRVLFFVLPMAALVIMWVALWKKFQRVMDNYALLVGGEKWLWGIGWALKFISLIIAGIEAIADNSWTTKAWILFTFGVVFMAVTILIFQFDNHICLDLSTIAIILCAIFFQWLWIELGNMPNNSDQEITWRHLSKNFIGFVVGYIATVSSLHLGFAIVYQFKNTLRCQEIFFWITAPAVLIALIIWDATTYPPFVDVIGIIIAGIFALVNCLITTIKNNQKERLLGKH